MSGLGARARYKGAPFLKAGVEQRANGLSSVEGSDFCVARLWRAACVNVAMSLLYAGCSNVAAVESEAFEPLAQVQAPTTESVTINTRAVPITFETSFGSGCDGDLDVDPSAARAGRLEIVFRSYRIDLSQSKSMYDTKQCTIDLKVKGARGYHYALQNVTFRGHADLLSPNAMLNFDTLVWWKGRTLASSEPSALALKGVRLGQWAHVQRFRAEADRASECFTEDGQLDELSISSSLVLVNPDLTLPAVAWLNGLSSDASVIVDVEPQKCTP